MSALPKLMIVGAGGFGREMLAWARQAVQCGVEWEVGHFIDDNLAALDGKNTPAQVVGRISDHQPRSDEVFICALGVPAVKRKVMELLLARGADPHRRPFFVFGPGRLLASPSEGVFLLLGLTAVRLPLEARESVRPPPLPESP